MTQDKLDNYEIALLVEYGRKFLPLDVFDCLFSSEYGIRSVRLMQEAACKKDTTFTGVKGDKSSYLETRHGRGYTL